jgi:hypothetical protein
MRARGSKRQAHGDLGPPTGCARQQQAAHVGAGDYQQQRYRGHQYQHRVA